MSGLDIRYVIVCDDVRREDNGKEILIGVYSSDILVPVLPANLQLVFWMHVYNDEVGEFPFEVRLTGPDRVQILHASAQGTATSARSMGSIWFGPVGVRVPKEGDLSLEFKRADDRYWSEIKQIPVRLRRPMAAQP
jgi:hypothetical protein